MEQKKITKEQFFKVLDTFFPYGCSGDRENWQTEWFCGWSAIDVVSSYDVALSISCDSETVVVFDFVNRAESCTSKDNVEMFIRGAMKVLFPDMRTDDTFDDTNTTHTICFGFKGI